MARRITYRSRTIQRSLVAALLATAAACGGQAPEPTAEQTPQVLALGPQDIAVAETGDVASGATFSGTLDPSEVADVKAQVAGTIRQLRVDRGVRVSRGQQLAIIEAEGVQGQVSGAQAQVASGQSAIAAAEANVAATRQKLEGARSLHAAGAMATVEFQSAEAQYEAAVGQLAAAKAQLAAAHAQLTSAGETARRTMVVAPLSGVVSKRVINEGEAVSSGQSLVTIVNTDQLELAGEVPVQQIGLVEVGQTVSFTIDSYPGQTFAGKVARIAPVADPATRRVGLALQLANPGGRLVAGQFVTGRVITANIGKAVLVPRSALRGEGTARYVLVVDGDTIARREVRVELLDDAATTVAVQSGLREGERVIVSPALDIPVGAKVRESGPVAKKEQ